MMPYVTDVRKFRTETKFVAKKNLLLVWTVMLISSKNFYVLSRTFAASFSGNRYQSHLMAFVQHRQRRNADYSCFCKRPRTASPIAPICFKEHRTTSVSLGAGRERRVSSSSSQNQQQQLQYTQEQQKLIEKEESERRKRLDQMERRYQKAVVREDRILILEAKLAREQETTASTDADLVESGESDNNEDDASNMTDAERAELDGLLRAQDNFVEQYDPQEFTEEHMEFKALHNDVFARLVRWCEEEVEGETHSTKAPTTNNNNNTNVFFLDGPDGGTASSLIHEGNFSPNQCYVANRHESTCVALKKSGGGLLPEENVVYATSSEALTKRAGPGAQQGALADIDFTGYYFDGCNGYAPHIVNMMSSALLVLEEDNRCDNGNNDEEETKTIHEPGHPIVVGYSVLGGTKNQVEKELEVSRALTIIARSRGMRIVHALDDPSRFGLPPNVPKLGGKFGNTFTSWLILEPE